MSKEPTTIQKHETLPKGMDFDFLRRESYRLAQELSGDIWTDYNEHDPGVTIMEQLSYALTELSYKSNLPVEDLFFSNTGHRPSNDELALYEAARILPCAPLTNLDYRKLIIDQVVGVKNAWVLPKKQSTLGMNLKGLYEVLLQVEDTARTDAVVAEVRQLLRAHRNVGEDFDHIRVLKPQKIKVVGEISINPGLEGETVMAHLLFDLFEAFSPQIAFKNLDEQLASGKSVDLIYEGPLPKHGFIDDEDLLRSEIHEINRIYKSGLIKRVSEVEGVVAVNTFSVTIDGRPMGKENYQLSMYSFPQLDIEGILNARSGMQLFVGDIPYTLDKEAVLYSFNILVAKYKQQFRKLLSLETPPPESTRKRQDILRYSSIQNSFPRIYGISDFGIPGRHTSERVAQARQLKAYLMLFEQHFLNYLAQLANVRELFTLDKEVKQTYFSQTPASIPNAAVILGKSTEELQGELDSLMQSFDLVHQRRNDFLDHLLARFGEQFLTDSFNAINRQASIFSKKEFEQASIYAKIEFLKQYPSISQNRGKGQAFLSNDNTASGLQTKICLLFNIHDDQTKPLSSLSHDKKMKVSKKKGKSDEAAAPKSGEFTFIGDEALLSDILSYGTSRMNYSIEEGGKDSKTLVVYFNHPTKATSSAICTAKTVEEGEEALNGLIAYLRSANAGSEGFHLIEHLLLRPLDLRFKFYLRDQSNYLLQTDFIYPDLEEGRQDFIQQVSEAGQDPKNYKTSKEKDGKVKVELYNKQGDRIAFIDQLLLADSAKQAIKTTSSLVKDLLEKGEDALLSQIGYEEQAKTGASLYSDPYSQQLSVVLPVWPAKFSNEKLRVLLEGIIRLNAPAHLRVNCFWLDMAQMQEFEEVYYQWVDIKSGPSPAQPLLDDLSLYLLFLLLSYQEGDPNEALVKESLPKLRKRFG
ncbi:MAG: hypothetical protein KDC44_09030 [Phaeodactylibacter sp.]|nr:hypothetical protein [Phaeodactylibacter sp.]